MPGPNRRKKPSSHANSSLSARETGDTGLNTGVIKSSKSSRKRQIEVRAREEANKARTERTPTKIETLPSFAEVLGLEGLELPPEVDSALQSFFSQLLGPAKYRKLGNVARIVQKLAKSLIESAFMHLDEIPRRKEVLGHNKEIPTHHQVALANCEDLSGLDHGVASHLINGLIDYARKNVDNYPRKTLMNQLRTLLKAVDHQTKVLRPIEIAQEKNAQRFGQYQDEETLDVQTQRANEILKNPRNYYYAVNELFYRAKQEKLHPAKGKDGKIVDRWGSTLRLLQSTNGDLTALEG